MENNCEVNFTLKSFTSILIGAYFFIAAFSIKTLLDNFLTEDHFLESLSIEILEVFIIVITFISFLFSTLTLFFSGKREAKKLQHKLWNPKTKIISRNYFIAFLLLFTLLLILLNLGFIDYITPTFLIFYGVLLFLLKSKERKNLLIISGLCFLLGIMCLLIPSYWYSSLSIIAIAHVAYGVVVKE